MPNLDRFSSNMIPDPQEKEVEIPECVMCGDDVDAHGDGWELNGDHYCCAECVAQDMGARKIG
jgi:hypothetical protein